MLKPAELSDKYEVMSRARDTGARDGSFNKPSQDDGPSETEHRIGQLAQADLNDLAAGQKKKNDRAMMLIREAVAKLPFELKHRAKGFLSSAEIKMGEVERELVRLQKVVLRRQQDHRLFMVLNRLEREASPAPSLYVALAWLALAGVADGGLNAYFFKDVGPLGLVGGFVIAFVISACNIALGFLTGWGPLRFFGHRYRLHLLWAVPLFLALTAAVLLFNLGAAHYRDLINFVPETEVAGVLDDLRNHATRVPTFQACLMAIVGIGVATFSAVKAYSMFDPYPWYGWSFKRQGEAEAEFEIEVVDVGTQLRALATDYLKRADEEYEQVSRNLQDVLGKYDEVISSNDHFELIAQGVEDACNDSLRQYRDANLQVRDNHLYPAPAHFFQNWSLARRSDLFDRAQVVGAREALKEREKQLKLAHEELQRTVPEESRRLLAEDRLKERLDDVRRIARREHDEEEEQRKRDRRDGRNKPDNWT
jgi:hypothetical protein